MRATQQNENDKGLRVEGYAAVFDSPTLMFEDGEWQYMEVVERGAFDAERLKNADTVFKYNHNDSAMILARTTNGTLELSLDEHGLKINADIIDNVMGNDVYKLIERGDLNKMSFAFTIEDENYIKDKEQRTITRVIKRVGELVDVAVVDFPAYDDTTINVRSANVEGFKKVLADEEEKRKRLILRTYF